MRPLWLAIAILLSVGVTLLPAAAAVQHAHAVKCMQLIETQHGDCDCCGDATPCTSSACATQCLNSQAGLTTDTGPRPVPREKLRLDLSALVQSLTISPDPPPPRS